MLAGVARAGWIAALALLTSASALGGLGWGRGWAVTAKGAAQRLRSSAEAALLLRSGSDGVASVMA